MLKLLIDRESGAKVSATLESTTQAFKAFQEKVKEPKERRSSSKGERKECIHCLSDRHDSLSCWYIHLE